MLFRSVTDPRQRKIIASNLSTKVPHKPNTLGKNWQEEEPVEHPLRFLAGEVPRAAQLIGHDELVHEEIADSDVIIALTDDDKLNLLVALVGKHMGIPKTVVRVGRPEYIMLMEQVGIDVVFSPRLLTASQILRFVRSGEGVVSISTFEGGKAESIEIEITNESPVAGKQLKDIRLPGKALVGVILRENEAIVPRGNTQILDGDHIVLFTLPESVSKLLKYLT